MNHETIFRKFDVMDIPKGSIVESRIVEKAPGVKNTLKKSV